MVNSSIKAVLFYLHHKDDQKAIDDYLINILHEFDNVYREPDSFFSLYTAILDYNMTTDKVILNDYLSKITKITLHHQEAISTLIQLYGADKWVTLELLYSILSKIIIINQNSFFVVCEFFKKYPNRNVITLFSKNNTILISSCLEEWGEVLEQAGLIKNDATDGLNLKDTNLHKFEQNLDIEGLCSYLFAENNNTNMDDIVNVYLNMTKKDGSIKQKLFNRLAELEKFPIALFNKLNSNTVHSYFKVVCSYFELDIFDDIVPNRLFDLILGTNDSELINIFCVKLMDKKLDIPEQYFDKMQASAIKSKNLIFLKEFVAEYIKEHPKRLNYILFKKRFNELASTFDRETSEDEKYMHRYWKYDKFVQYLFDKKDFYFLETILPKIQNFEKCTEYAKNGSLFEFYCRKKNKTFENLYEESWKKDVNLLIQLAFILKLHSSYSVEFDRICAVSLEGIINACQNVTTYLKYIKRIAVCAELYHNIDNSDSDSDFDFLNILKIAILNPSIDVEDENLQEFLELVNNLSKYEDNWFVANASIINKSFRDNQKSNIDLINMEELSKDFGILHDLKNKFHSGQNITFQNGSTEYVALKNLYTSIDMILNYKTISKYINNAKPKDQRLFDLNIELPNGIVFNVLKFLDPYAFKVGKDTGCCQRIGGVGEDAAIDSFINPLAGVLVCKFDGKLISQSYFHYVPNDNGYILDNIEWNKYNCQEININSVQLSKIYADFAREIKNKYPEIKYIKCGEGYNKINNSMFAENEMQNDPRHFEHDEQYTDFDAAKHLDLLQPQEDLNKVQVRLNSQHNEQDAPISSPMQNVALFNIANLLFIKNAMQNKNVVKQIHAFNSLLLLSK